MKKTIIKHEDLMELYHEAGFDDDFKFIGTDRKVYKFNADEFNFLIKEYGEEPVLDSISTINGSIKIMVEHKIAKLSK